MKRLKTKKQQLLFMLIAVLSLIILATTFLPLINTSDFSVRGFETIFGYQPSYQIGNFSAAVKFSDFSWPSLIAYLLPLLSLLIALIPIKKYTFMKCFSIAILNIGSLILFILIIDFFKQAIVTDNLLIQLYFNSLTFKYSYGAYITIIASTLNVFLSSLLLVIH